MSLSRTHIASLRVTVAFLVLHSLLLMPARAMPAAEPCPAPNLPPMECGACCETMTCCVQTPEQPAPPAIPAANTHSSSEFAVALMAATRPLLWLIPAGQQDFVPYTSVPCAGTTTALALLCIRLI